MPKLKFETACQMNDDDITLSTPEHRLWESVMLSALHDIDWKLECARNQQDELGYASLGYKWAIEAIEREVDSDWYLVICLFVDKHPDQIRNRIGALKDKYKYTEINFVPRGTVIQTVIALKSRKKAYSID